MRYLISLFFGCLTCISLSQDSCPSPQDSDGNGFIGSADLIDLLANFGDSDLDGDGIWDSEDDCVGEYDECGVCNGPGPTEVVVQDITIIYDSLYAEQIDEWLVFEVGTDTVFTFTCYWECGMPLEYQGYDYATGLIGDQCWFAENMRSENYDNGDAIPSNLSDSEYNSTTSGATSVYEGSASNLQTYGRLYNWYAVDDTRGLCPSGWHIPTDGEWTVMTDFLGGESVAGGKMKTAYGWSNGGIGTNSSGFSGLPTGFRNGGGNFGYIGNRGYWWSSSPIDLSAWCRYLHPFENVVRSDPSQRQGFSVRCIQD